MCITPEYLFLYTNILSNCVIKRFWQVSKKDLGWKLNSLNCYSSPSNISLFFSGGSYSFLIISGHRTVMSHTGYLGITIRAINAGDCVHGLLFGVSIMANNFPYF